MSIVASRPITCMLLAPRSSAFQLQKQIDPLFKKLGHKPVRLDVDEKFEGNATDSAARILMGIHTADAVIADVTGSNPNVMYELGVAHGLKKPVLIIMSETEASIAFDLSGKLYYTYDPKNPIALNHSIQNWIRRVEDKLG